MKKIWKDETGVVIPANRITRSEKLRETKLESLLKKAKQMNDKLIALKVEMADTTDEIFEAVMEENGIDTTNRKGNFLTTNFDRSIKLEVDVTESIVFDDALIAVAKEHFDAFLSNGTGGIDEMIRELIMDAFSNSRGRLDSKKVLGLIKYRTRIDSNKYPAFHLAIDAIERSISRPSSKRYFRISERSTDGKYEVIDLNFSSI